MPKKCQFVWPKDGPKGKSGNRGFFGGLGDIITGKGPDIFIDKKGSQLSIKPDYWGNWDAYHDPTFQMKELRGGAYPLGMGASRGLKRYDPYTRTYKEWYTLVDWGHVGTDGRGIFPHGDGYVHFTAKEGAKINRRLTQGRQVDATRMGSKWTHQAPKRFREEYDWFWQDAHRMGENARQGLNIHARAVNPFMHMHNCNQADVVRWIQRM